VERGAEFVVMQYARSGGDLLPVAILLFDPSADRLLGIEQNSAARTTWLADNHAVEKSRSRHLRS